jgi:hypothetical protein
MAATNGRHRAGAVPAGPVAAPALAPLPGPPVPAAPLCACGCGRPRDRDGKPYRRECHNKYMRNWRARRKLSADDLDFIKTMLLQTAGLLSQAIFICGCRTNPTQPLCGTCRGRQEKIDQARELARRLAQMGRRP